MRLPSFLFGLVLKVMPRACVDIILIKEGKILVLRRAIEPTKGYWALPGGSILLGETTEEAAIRKVKQETGLNINIDNLKLIDVVTIFVRKLRQDICITYTSPVNDDQKVKLDFQHDSYQWIKPPEYPRNIEQPVISRIKKASEQALQEKSKKLN